MFHVSRYKMFTTSTLFNAYISFQELNTGYDHSVLISTTKVFQYSRNDYTNTLLFLLSPSYVSSWAIYCVIMYPSQTQATYTSAVQYTLYNNKCQFSFSSDELLL